MIISEVDPPGCRLIRGKPIRDERGSFTKIFQAPAFASQGMGMTFREEYFTVSERRVLRGLHFQVPPAAHSKLVYCVTGSVLDVLVDIRIGSPAYGRAFSFELDSDEGTAIFLPEGIAHGFYVLKAPATLVYKVTSVYASESDKGILWNSIDFQWPDPDPILSARDQAFPPLLSFQSPFRYSSL